MFEEYYNNFYKELSKIDDRNNTFDKIKSILPLLKGDEKIIDIGCGHGSVTHELVKKGFEVTGVEINDEALESLKNKGFRTIKRDITMPLNIDEKFYIIFILDVLEHIFNPFALLTEAKEITKENGYIIISVPLYFDLLDRIKILFTGNIISLDNLCYGIDNYRRFRTFNYDHIRFFRPKEVLEMGEKLNLKIEQIEYLPSFYLGKNFALKFFMKLLSNKITAPLAPNLLSHSMKVRWKVV
jgi:2-polyprenyl-3-methyl-5-hydroxy-6-metoxy-1,4-benzoquinol methylase